MRILMRFVRVCMCACVCHADRTGIARTHTHTYAHTLIIPIHDDVWYVFPCALVDEYAEHTYTHTRIFQQSNWRRQHTRTQRFSSPSAPAQDPGVTLLRVCARVKDKNYVLM